MPESILVQKEVEALQLLERLAAERARAESETERGFRSRKENEERGFQETFQKVNQTGKAEIASTEARYRSVKAELQAKFEAERQATETEYNELRRKIATKAASVKKSAKKAMEEARWQVLAVFESAKESVVKRHKELEGELKAALEHLNVVKDDSAAVLDACRKFIKPAGEAAADPAATPPTPPDEPLPALQEKIALAEEQLEPLANLKILKFLRPQQFIWPFVILGLALAYPLGTALGWPIGLGIDAALAIGAAIGVRVWLGNLAKTKVEGLHGPLVKTLEEADVLTRHSQDWVKANLERRKAEIEKRREDDSGAAEEKFNATSAEADRWSVEENKKADEKYPALLKDIEQRRVEAVKQADERYPRRLAELKEKLEADVKQLQENYKAQKEATQRAHVEAWTVLFERWKNGLAEVNAIVTEVNETCDRLFLDWHHVEDATKVESPTAAPPAMRFGQFEIDLSQIPQGIPTDERLKALGPTRHTLPALLPFPVMGSLLLKVVNDASKVEAAKVLQSVMLRYLSSVPPGKVRFTIIDPVGLGENYSAFMHLGDYSELLVTNRIWTEAAHIEQRLTDLQEHMENVIQKYLRNEFQTIEEYNVHAGEVAEPFRILVVANFPAGFNESATRRLLSIASSGARCGVFTLVSADTKQQLMSGFQLKDLEPYAVNMVWVDGKFSWRDPHFARFPLQLDTPPDQETYSKQMHVIGERARNANRVEVPFEFIAPKPHEYWTGNTSKGVEIPLGRAGATKVQSMKLGKGTSQHVLTAGKTGSGKSTLLHALIMNAALKYSPDELQLYLIDFKKGVEFKVYAAFQLPHAKVIAVESEREFGLSVLQRLDLELKTRGDKFRDLGVQDLGGYRQIEGQPPLPRVLFIIDEFQEFFVEDDKIAQDVTLLLDRLVRQGRAFGVHVILGSQSLGGSYSLPRTTLGQMAVRIALQCSEADSNLILSEDNGAARLLTRPGEAIYNDQNGMMEGNNFFQVVWLNDDRREDYLTTIQGRYQELNRPPVEQIVFEGNLPAVVAKNYLLDGLLRADDWGAPPKADHAWLGEAIAIKDPTAAVFRPQSGSNLLIVGQNSEMALGIMATAMAGFAAQHVPYHHSNPNVGLQIFLLDGTPVDSSMAGMLAKVGEAIPHRVKNVTWRELAAVLAHVAAEVDRRQKEPGETPPIYLFIYDLQRFRDLRKAEDDFGFSSRYGEEKAAPPSKLFGNILRDGPPVGVHTIVWCDSLNNLNRTFDRQGLKEFEIRILFQMSANDSSTLIDSPVGGKLGENRALFFSEEEGKLEKFRPYAYPPDEWLAYVNERLGRRPAAVALESLPPDPEITLPTKAPEPAMPSFGSGDSGSYFGSFPSDPGPPSSYPSDLGSWNPPPLGEPPLPGNGENGLTSDGNGSVSQDSHAENGGNGFPSEKTEASET